MKACAPSCVVLCASHRCLHPWTSSEAKQATEGRKNGVCGYFVLDFAFHFVFILHFANIGNWGCECITVLHIIIDNMQEIAITNTMRED